MINFKTAIYLLLSVFIAINLWGQENQKKVNYDFQLELNAENRIFFSDGAYPAQENNYISIAAQPEFELSWNDDRNNVKGVFWGRYDQHDNNRSNIDIRELYFQRVIGSSEFSIGVKKVFWGITESAHLVDIINQTDAVESFDGEQKLGEAMIHFSQYTTLGTFDIFFLPYFRKREFPGKKGRLRFGSEDGFLLKKNDIKFTGNADIFYPSVAFRWSHYLNFFDFGLSYFRGIGREPIIVPDPLAFKAVYDVINQFGVELQATTGPMLWKLESIYRQNAIQDVTKLAAGFEYTFGNIASSGIDLGILSEYLYDDLDELSFSGQQNDVFTGVRLSFNDIQDTQFLAGSIFDIEHTTKLYFVESQRRLGESWKLSIEARIFNNVDIEEFTFFIRKDSFLQLSLSRYF